MNFIRITKNNYDLLAFIITTNLSPILGMFSFCDERNINASCNCSSITKFHEMNSKCHCMLTSNKYEMSCSDPDTKLTITMIPFPRSYGKIEIRCYNIESHDKFKRLLPTIKLGWTDDLTIEMCPFPVGGRAISSLLENLGVDGILLYAVDIATNPLTKQIHFNTIVFRKYNKTDIILQRFLEPRLEKTRAIEIVHSNTLKDIDEQIVDYTRKQEPHQILIIQVFYKLPSDFFELLRNLQFISLNGNIELTENMFRMNKELEVFALSGSVPSGFRILSPQYLPSKFLAYLPKLKHVFFYDTNYTSIPEDIFFNSPNLEGIQMIDCEITSLPNGLFNSQLNLTYLILTNNHFKYIPEELLKNARLLISLGFGEIFLQNFSSIIIHHTPNLKELVIHQNHLTADNIEFEETFATHSELKIIDLSYNKINYIPKHWHIPCHLETMNLKGNQLIILNAFDLGHLISDGLYLDLSYNQIVTVNFKELDDVRQLSNTNVTTNIEHNPIHCDCDLLSFLLFLRHEYGSHIWNNTKFETNYLMCATPTHLADKYLHQFEMMCYTGIDNQVQPLDLICPLHPNDCPNSCKCWRRDHDQHLVIDCSNLQLSNIPELPIIGRIELTGIKPHLEKHQLSHIPLSQATNYRNVSSKSSQLNGIELHLENNEILELPTSSAPGYANVTKLFAAGNNLTSIAKSQLPTNLTYLDVSRNHIESIDNQTLQYINQSSLINNVLLSENPWRCECNDESLFLLRFTQGSNDLIPDAREMICHETQKHFYELQDLCYGNQHFNIILGVTLCTIGLLLGSLVALYYKYQRELKIWLYAHNWCLWLVTEEELDKDKIYDAFISYSSKDEVFIYNHLIPELENGSPPFRLCVYGRDWLVGTMIPDQIIRSIEDSKRTIVVLSQNFIESVWAKMEFKTAHQSALNEGRAKVIVIMYTDIEDNDNLDEDLKAYLKINIYLKWGDPQFWNKLRYAMPHFTARKCNELEYVPLHRNF